MTYVNSLGLGDPASADTVLRRLERYPRLRFKLDAAVTWTPELVDALVGTGAVHTIDFKGHYGMEFDRDSLPGLYARLLDAFPDALIEDPHDLPEIAALVEPHAQRVSYDAPINTVADLDAVPMRAQTFNVEPSRVGHLRDVFAAPAASSSSGVNGLAPIARQRVSPGPSATPMAGEPAIAAPGPAVSPAATRRAAKTRSCLPKSAPRHSAPRRSPTAARRPAAGNARERQPEQTVTPRTASRRAIAARVHPPHAPAQGRHPRAPATTVPQHNAHAPHRSGHHAVDQAKVGAAAVLQAGPRGV